MKEPHLVLGLGELLWDMLPEGPRLGGAPANYSVMAGRLGNHAVLLSRIGRDELGRKAIERLAPMPVDAGYLQTDPAHETGRVTVSFAGGERVQPAYSIQQPVAWDFFELSDEWLNLAGRADAICFGSLAQRSAESRQTIQALVAQTGKRCIRVFDVNLREPFYRGEVIHESLELATVMKMNDAEAPVVLGLLGLPFAVDAAPHAQPGEEGRRAELAAAQRLLREFPTLQLVAITRGGQGSLLVTREEWHEHPGIPVQLVDTIGAGDAFTAALTHYLLLGANLATLNEAGNRWGSWVASQSGAMPFLADDIRAQITAAIGA